MVITETRTHPFVDLGRVDFHEIAHMFCFLHYKSVDKSGENANKRRCKSYLQYASHIPD